MKWIFGILCLFFSAYSFGVRLHPEHAASLFQHESFEHYYEIEFISGQKMTGRLVSDRADSIEITVGAGTAVFKNREIKNKRLLAAEEVKAEAAARRVSQKSRQDPPLISVRYEDSLFYTAEKRWGALFLQAAANAGSGKNTDVDVNTFELQRAADTYAESGSFAPKGLPTASMPSSAVRGLASDHSSQEQDYTALIKAGLDKLRNADNQKI